MTTDPLALVAAMPLPEPCTLVEVFEPGFRLPVEAEPASDYYTADQYRAARLEAAQLVLAQGEPVEWQSRVGPKGAWRKVDGGKERADYLLTVKNGSGHCPYEVRALYAAPFAPVNAEVLAALKEVLRISDRKHVAWDTAKAWVASAEAASREAT